MRVLFVTHRAELSGGEKSLLELLAHFVSPAGRNLGIEPLLAVPQDGPLSAAAPLAVAARQHGVPVSYFPLPDRVASISLSPDSLLPRFENWTQFAVARSLGYTTAALRRIAVSERAEVVVTNSQKAHVFAALTLLLGRPLVWYFRDVLRRTDLSLAMNLLARARCRAVVFNSEAARQALFTSPKPIGTRLAVVHPGIADPVESSAILQKEAAALRRRLGIPKKARLLVAPGQIARWKGQDVLLQAMPEIRRSVPDAAVLIAGNVVFPENEKTYGESLYKRAEDPDLRGSVYFAGRVDPIWPALHAAELAVHCARAPEPFGRVIVESQRAGIPVIASDAGGPREIVENEKTGLLVTPGDPALLATACIRLLRDRPLSARLALAGAASSRRFTPAAAAEALAAILRA